MSCFERVRFDHNSRRTFYTPVSKVLGGRGPRHLQPRAQARHLHGTPADQQMADEDSTSALRIAIVAPSLAILGGQAVQAQRLLEGWRDDRDVRAFLVPINPEPKAWLRPLTRIKYVRTLITQLSYLPLLVRSIPRADVVHVFSASYWSFVLAPLPAVIVSRIFGRPVVLNYHSGEAPDHLRRSGLARYTLGVVDRNVVPSPFLQDVFADHGIEAQVIPNTIDHERFRFRERDPLRPRLLSTRNFEPLYGIECTLRAFRRVQDRFPEATLTLVGSGSQDAALRGLATDLGLRGVTFAGRVDPAQIHAYYDAADIYVQTPTIDNMPCSILEASAAGLPIVSTEAGGVPAMLTDGVHALLAPIGDADMIASHVATLLDDPERARQMARAAYELTDRYRWSAVRDTWLAVYRGTQRPVTVEAQTRPA